MVLPKPWGLIGLHTPIGAAGHLLRSVAFFDGEGSGGNWATQIVWILAGDAILVGVAILKRKRPGAYSEDPADDGMGDDADKGASEDALSRRQLLCAGNAAGNAR